MLLYHLCVLFNKHFLLAINVFKATLLFSSKNSRSPLLVEVLNYGALKRCEDTHEMSMLSY